MLAVIGQPQRVAPTLMPADAYRRTWFAERLDELCGKGLFGAILSALAPADAARADVRDATPRGQLLALLQHIRRADLFPINPGIEFELDMNDNEFDWQDALYYGIPVETFGFDWDGDPVEPDTAICIEMSNNPEFDEVTFNSLNPFRADIADHLKRVGKPPQLPRGRAWVKPWDAAGILFNWANGTTGNRWLDYTDAMLSESNLPTWNLGEIHALAADWKRTKPDVERLAQLRAMLEKSPRQNLPLLAGALAGDRATLERITRKVKSEK